MGNAQYKLFYFNFKFRGEVIRLIFHAAGEPFEDVRFEGEDWPKYKSQAPFGNAPYLHIIAGSKTEVISQSVAIARYVARKFKLAGKNDEESALVDMYADQVTDLLNEFARIFRENDPGKKKEKQQKFETDMIPSNMKLFEKRISESKSGFFAPSGLTWVDLYLFNFLDMLGEKRGMLLDRFPNIKGLDQKVRANPRISAYLNKRPVTPF